MKLAISSGAIAVDERDGVLHARGLRYGRSGRFEAATPPPRATGDTDATRPGPVCPQRPGRLDFVTGPVLGDLPFGEDCLVLSVTAPAGSEHLPVMVWFHGGAYVAGTGEAPKYDATSLAREGDVVVVNVSYRLGIFGYANPIGHGGADNAGLRDQILALQWVRDNIAAFGGDPENVTAFGQSAGADSVVALMLCDEAIGLFHRAIVQSAPLGVATGNAEVIRARERMAAAVDQAIASSLTGTDARSATWERLLQAEAAGVAAAQGFGWVGGLVYAPRMGRGPLPTAAELTDRIAYAARRVELLIGRTKHDAAPFVAMKPQVARLSAVKPLQRSVVLAAGPMATSRFFGAAPFVRAWRAHGGRAGTYRFDWQPRRSPLGACHCMELPFLFGAAGAWSDAPMLGPGREIDQELAVHMRSVWTGFARRGVQSLPAASMTFG
jgi:para-nitrobenzyl esterase